MPIPKKKPITKREIEDNDVTVDNEDVTTKSSEAENDCFDDVRQNPHPTSSIDEFEDDEDLFADLDLDDIDGFDDDLLYSLIPMVVVAVIQKIMAFLSLKFAKVRDLIDGKSSYIIIHGKINVNEMKKQRYNMGDLYTQLRSFGIKSIQEVEIAILETSGNLSAFKAKKDIDASLPVIVSGEIDYVLLNSLGKDKTWIEKEIKKNNINLKDVLGACIIDNKLDIVEKI